MSYEAVLSEALALPDDERAALVKRLSETLAMPANDDARRAQAAELRRRIDDVTSGRVEPIAGDVFVAEMRAKLNG